MLEATARQYHLEPTVDHTSRLSKISQWGDVRWSLDNPTAGASTSSHTCRWDFDLPDGSLFTDPQHGVLLDSMKRLLWSLFTDNRGRRNLKPGNLGWLSSGLRFFVRWMIATGLSRVDQFDEKAGALYLRDIESLDDFLEEEIQSDLEGQEGEDVTFSQVYLKLSVPIWLYQQREVLREAGIEPPSRHPYGGQPAKDVAKRLTEQLESQVLPLPTDVALPILREAYRLLGVPAEDVIRLQELYLTIRDRRSSTGQPLSQADTSKISETLRAFEFSCLPGEPEPWRAPLAERERRVGAMAPYSYAQQEIHLAPGTMMAALVTDIASAALIVLQAFTGMRISEVAGLLSGTDDESGLPHCVVIRSSRTGLNDVFYIRGRLFKMTDSFREAEWLCGIRPKGSTYVPPVVHAVMVLERLLQPWRDLGGRKELFVSFRTGRGLPRRASSVRGASTLHLLFAQKRFVAQHVHLDWHALPDKDIYRAFRARGGWALRTHQWRKTFAHFMFATDQSSLPLISQQFKHLSLAMTEQAYLGNDPELLALSHQTRLAMTTRTFYEAIHGERLMTGGFARLVDEHRASLAQLIYGKTREEGMEALESYIVRHDLRLWFQDHGKCAVAWRPLEAACHREAGTESSKNKAPNWSTRKPSLCSGCGCWFTDPDHKEFWHSRYKELRQSILSHKGHLPPGVTRLLQLRAYQAAGWLRAIGEQLPTDQEVIGGAQDTENIRY